MVFLLLYLLHTEPPHHFHLEGCGARPGKDTCHAAYRLNRGVYDISIANGLAEVNGTLWGLEESGDTFILTHHVPLAYTSLTLIVQDDHGFATGEISLAGITEHRQPCTDRAMLLGRAW